MPQESPRNASRLAPRLAIVGLAAALAAACQVSVQPTSVATTGKPGAGGGNLVSKGGGNLVSKGGGNLVPQGGGNLVPQGGGNLVPQGGGNLVTQGGDNVRPPAAPLVPQGGGNLVPQGGGNLVPVGGGNLVPVGGGNFQGPHAAFAIQLQDLATIGHNRAAAQIIATNGAGVVSNNTGSLLAKGGGNLIGNNAGGLIGNNAGGLIGNNAGGLVGNNGGQAISNNGGTYRVFQLAAPAFAITPAEGEAGPVEAKLPDGTTAFAFDRPDGSRRIVVVNAAQRPLEQQLVTGIQAFDDGALKASHTERTLVYGADQTPRGFLSYDETYDAQGRMSALTHQPSRLVEPKSGLEIAVEALALTVEPPAGRFEVRFKHLKAVEKGTFDAVVRNVAGRGVGLDLADPLATMGGESRFETDDGTLLFTRRAELAGAEHRLTLGLRAGYALALKRATRTAPYEGEVTLDGKRIGTASLAVGKDAAVTYEVKFDGDAAPLSIRLPDATP